MFDLVGASKILKQIYSDQEIVFKLTEYDPFLREIDRQTDYGGDSFNFANVFANTQGASGDFATAMGGNGGMTQYARFKMDKLSKMYHTARWDREAMLRAAKKRDAFVIALQSEVDSCLEQMRNKLETEVWGNGGGALCQLSSDVAKNTPTLLATAGGAAFLADKTQIINLQVNMPIEIAATDGTTGAIRTVATAAFVKSLNYDLATVAIKDVNGNDLAWIDTPSSAGPPVVPAVPGLSAATAAGDFLFQTGDFRAVMSRIPGVLGWIPLADPAPGSDWFGVDRSVDRVKLAGSVVDVGSSSMQEGLIGAMAQAHMLGAAGQDRLYINALRFADLAVEMYGYNQAGAGVRRGEGDKDQMIGFQGITLMGARGAVKVYPAPRVPRDFGLLTKIADWHLLSCGNVPEIIKEDGLIMRRSTTSDGYIEQFGWLATMYTDNPRNSCLLHFA